MEAALDFLTLLDGIDWRKEDTTPRAALIWTPPQPTRSAPTVATCREALKNLLLSPPALDADKNVKEKWSSDVKQQFDESRRVPLVSNELGLARCR